ncbi:MAG: hypothetical protein JSU63_02680 [Phycisphaerales bacterium]|nr:MAG: hypothetical protein JSU63_02680 [Phycisphaerales bacterium]
MTVTARADVPVVTLRFFTFLPPEITVEVSRLQMTQAHAEAMVDVLAKNFDYYPKKPKTGSKAP